MPGSASEPGLPELDTRRLKPAFERAGLQADFRTWTTTYLGRFSSDIWRLDFDNGVRLIAKRGFRESWFSGLQDKEAAFYVHLGTRLNHPVPRFVMDHDGVLLLEWLELIPFSLAASPGFDLAVFTTMSFPAATRATLEADLVAEHALQLKTLGCRWVEPWRDYQLGLLLRVARVVELADHAFSSLPWVFRRTALAVLDNRAIELIR